MISGATSREDPRRSASGLLTAAKFVSVGAVSSVVTIALFNLLVHATDHPPLASRPVAGYVIAMMAGLAVNYAGNRYWVFGGTPGSSRVREVTRFLVANAFAIAVPVLCLGFSRYVLDLDSVVADNISANVVGLILATLSRWFAYKYAVFRPAA